MVLFTELFSWMLGDVTVRHMRVLKKLRGKMKLKDEVTLQYIFEIHA